MEIRINEMFYSLQGEGANTGRPAIFIRLAGCNAKCPFCDTQHQAFEKIETSDLVEKVSALLPESTFNDNIVFVITGGEPTIQYDGLKEFATLLKTKFPNNQIAMETNGTSDKDLSFIDFVTISPKNTYDKHAIVKQSSCQELKLLYPNEENPNDVAAKISAQYHYLQPITEDTVEKTNENIKKTIEFIENNPMWRLSLQTQKIVNIQ